MELKEELGLDGKPFVCYSLKNNERDNGVIENGLIEISEAAERTAEVISPAIDDVIRIAMMAGETGPILSLKFRSTIRPEKASIECVLSKLRTEERYDVSVVLLERFKSSLGKAVVRELFPGCFH